MLCLDTALFTAILPISHFGHVSPVGGFVVKFIRDAYRREPGPTLRKSSKYLVNFRRRSGGYSSSYPGRKTFGDGRFIPMPRAACLLATVTLLRPEVLV
jgi:hypothetical protein